MKKKTLILLILPKLNRKIHLQNIYFFNDEFEICDSTVFSCSPAEPPEPVPPSPGHWSQDLLADLGG